MGKGRVYADDSQIDYYAVVRRGVMPGGCVDVEITEIEQAQAELFK
jgi:Holliday junction resolvase RusA-like endonuclease